MRAHGRGRPGPRRVRGAAAWGTLALVALTGCSDHVEVAVPELDADERARCEALLADVPDTLVDGERREVSPSGAPAIAWGDPAVVLVCGVPVPEEYDEFSACTDVDGVGWFVPDSQLTAPEEDVQLTALSHSPHLQLQFPAARRNQGADAAMTHLAPLVRRHLSETSPCH